MAIFLFFLLGIYNVVGLPTKIDSRMNEKARAIMDDSAIIYMRELYANISKGTQDINMLLNPYDKDNKRVNKVVSFITKESVDSTEESAKRFSFKIRKVDLDEFFYSQIRIYYDGSQNELRASRVKLFRTTENNNDKLIGETEIQNIKNSQWIVFNTTDDTYSWFDSTEQEYGLAIRIYNKESASIPIHKSGIIGSDGRKDKRPIAVHFDVASDYIFEEDIIDEKRKKRSIIDEITKQREKIKTKASQKQDFQSEKRCGKEKFYIKFSDLGEYWKERVLSPQGFELNLCRGHCDALIDNTPHALLQSLVHITQGTVPKPCCAPSKTTPLTVLKYDDEGNPTLVNLLNMVAEQCQCQ